MQTNTASLGSLFSNGNSYTVPPFQRQYSWGEEEWEDLWDDLWNLRTAEASSHFMGALVLKTESSIRFVVVDGQQRLTTITILGLAVIHAIEAQPGAGNLARAAILRRLILGDEDPASLTRVGRLTLSRADDGFFRDFILPSIQPSNPLRFPESNRRLLQAAAFFQRKITAGFGPDPSTEELARFLNETVARRLQFLVITVEDDANAYRLFETLNARGVSLSPADLIRNYLYSLAADSPVSLAAIDRAWLRLTGVTGLEQFPEFLRQSLAAQHGRIRRDHLFRTVRKQAPDRAAAQSLLQSLESDAELYSALNDTSHEYWRGRPEDRRRVRALQLLRAPQFNPILFETFTRFRRDDFSRVLKLTVVLAFRAITVARQESSVIESTAADAARRVRAGEITAGAALSAALAPVYVRDQQFLHGLEGLSLQTPGRDSRLARYILFELERDAGHLERDMDSDSATIEHILPDAPSDSWYTAFPAAQAESYVCRLGNLTLLEPALNRDAAARPFPEKLPLYARSTYALTQSIGQLEWTPDTISARQHQLATRALHIWRSDFADTP